MQVLKSSIIQICLLPVSGIRYIINLGQYMRQARNTGGIKIKGFIPMLLDRYKAAGTIDRHYFLQDIYVAKKVIKEQPQRHFDVGSRVDGFIAHLLAGLEGKITIIDVVLCQLRLKIWNSYRQMQLI